MRKSDAERQRDRRWRLKMEAKGYRAVIIGNRTYWVRSMVAARIERTLRREDKSGETE